MKSKHSIVLHNKNHTDDNDKVIFSIGNFDLIYVKYKKQNKTNFLPGNHHHTLQYTVHVIDILVLLYFLGTNTYCVTIHVIC